MPPILMYHHIADPPDGCRQKPALFVRPEEFDEQLQWLKAHRYVSVSLDQLLQNFQNNQPLPKRSAIITFDDGYTNNFDAAFALLKKHDFTATFFVTSGEVGRRDVHGYEHMTADQLRELQSSGMAVESHTVSHPWLGRIALDEAREELGKSKETLEDILSSPVRWLCYPSGSFSDDVIKVAQESGYLGACSVIRDNRPKPRQLFYLPRVMVMRGMSTKQFAHLFDWSYHYLHAWKNRKRWPGR